MTDGLALNLTPLLPEIVLFLAALALLVVGAFKDKEGARIVTVLAVISLILAALLTLALSRTTVLAMGGHFVEDGFAAFFKMLIFLGAAGSLIVANGYMRDAGIERFEYPVLALFSTLGMSMMVSANSLLALYMALELTSLPLYVMAAFNRDTVRSSEAGLKYFILGALASGMLLYGCSLVYGFNGSLMFGELGRALSVDGRLPVGTVVGIVFILAGLAFKLGAVPFHMWTPDVYEGSPTPVSTFFASAPKIAAMGLLIRVLMQPFGHHVVEWQQVVILISVLSMLLGAFAAIGQTNIKRLMAYSSIGHIGYAFVGLSAGTEKGVVAVLVYMAIYVVMTVGTFACILKMRRDGRYIETIADLAGLSASRPMMAACFAIFMFSLAGIPPLAGFFGKLYVFMAAVDAGYLWLALFGALTSVVGAYYYLRIVKIIYFDDPAAAFDNTPHPALNAVSVIAAALILFFIVVPGPVTRAAGSAAASLVTPASGAANVPAPASRVTALR
ncbi:NADH dehydrogenase subunit N [Arboricoccus pini]|uniref:NADH-quinone oxidoreductase subunit N n=1 Tax=Arboricoccus pini TaxID=1963835 RepID=A0A212PWC9_9PROT|nr:NADH-quinone oxidoreductase subunit NuoN [Arboricoccus pini]SNB51287.1 NADH dehydrogenase subunit N [Arboricoccus pini]